MSFSVNVCTNNSGRLSRACSRPDTPTNSVPSDRLPVAEIGSSLSVSRQRPTASKFSKANPTGSIKLWHLAHVSLARCCSSRSPHRQRCGNRVVLQLRHIWRRRRRRAPQQVRQAPSFPVRLATSVSRTRSPSRCCRGAAIHRGGSLHPARHAGNGCRKRAECHSVSRVVH